MKPRHIAMLSVHTCPLATLGGKETGGMNVYVRDFTRELTRRGIYVDVFTRSQNPHLPHVIHTLGETGRVIHIPAGPEEPYDKNKVFDHLPEFVDNVVQFAEREGITYDLIHSHYWLSGWAARELRDAWSRRSGETPIVQMFHTLGYAKNQIAAPGEREPEHRIKVEKEIARFADRLVAATPAEEEQLVEHYYADPRKISIIPPGVDLTLFHPHSPKDAKLRIGVKPCDNMILFVGRIEPLKGVDTLIRAMAVLRENCTRDRCPHDLVIIGGDPQASPESMNAEMARLQALCKELGLEDMVLFLGKRGQDTLPYYYSAAEVLVMPSHYESFGLVALEAMACGTPVIASRVGGLQHTVDDGVTGFLVPPGDENALAEKLRLVLSDGKLRRRMGANARKKARSFTWQKVAGHILPLYEELWQQNKN